MTLGLAEDSLEEIDPSRAKAQALKDKYPSPAAQSRP